MLNLMTTSLYKQKMGNYNCIKILILILSTSFSNFIYAQNKKLEEAKHLFTDVRAYNVAKKLLDEVISENPSEDEAYYYRGQLHYDLMNYHAAREDFSKAIEIENKYSDHYYQRGLVLLKMKDYKGAIRDFSKAINLRKGGSDTYYVARAEAYRLSQKYDKAINDCEEAMVLNPNNGIARSIRGLIDWNLGKSASTFFRAATLADVKKDEKALIHYYYAIYCEGTGKYEKALTNYTAAINLDKIPVEYYYGKANLELKLQNYKEAKETADIVIRKHKRLTETYVTRAICNYKEKVNDEYEQDIRYFFKWAEYNKMQNPESYIANLFYKYLVETSINQDEFLLKRLEKWMEKAIEKNNSAENNILYAKILFKSGNNSKIQKLADNISNITDINPEEKNEFDRILAEINNVTADKIPPKINITTPAFEAKRGVIVVEATKKMIVKGQAQDESGIKKVSINGNPARLLANGRFSGEVILSKGDNLITVRAEDFAGNTESKPFVIRKEETIAKTKVNKPKEKTREDFSRLGTHRALLFATDEYDEWGRLMNPINDAETIARDLERLYGFETEVVKNPTGRKIIEKLREYNAKSYGADDELFIFFAGHGQYDEMLSEGYIVAKDSKLQEVSKLSYVPHSTIRTYTNSIPCEHIFLVMDVCFGGTFDPLVAARGNDAEIPASTITLVNRLLFYKTRKYFTSGGKEYVSDGVAGKHSPFVRIFLEALRKGGGNDGVLTADEIVLFFEEASPKPQYGQFGANEPGSSFVFVPRY